MESRVIRNVVVMVETKPWVGVLRKYCGKMQATPWKAE
jgi:hypothetical protein